MMSFASEGRSAPLMFGIPVAFTEESSSSLMESNDCVAWTRRRMVVLCFLKRRVHACWLAPLVGFGGYRRTVSILRRKHA